MDLIVITFLAVFLLALTGSMLLQQRRAVRARMSEAVRPRIGGVGLADRFATARESVAWLVDPLQKMVPRSAAEASVIRRRMIMAGYRKPFHVELFYASKVLVPAAAVLIMTVTDTSYFGPFFSYALGLGLGFLVPDFWLGNRIAKRKLNMQLGLAEALDLMVVCIEAGLSLDQTIQRVATELNMTQPEICEEFDLLHLEQRAGHPRAEAWRNLAERTNLDSIRALTSMLIQADQLGTSVATCLRVHSDSLRTQRRQQAEEQAAKTTVKLVFPLVFFIFPSLFVVVLGPSMLMIVDAFDKYLLN